MSQIYFDCNLNNSSISSVDVVSNASLSVLNFISLGNRNAYPTLCCVDLEISSALNSVTIVGFTQTSGTNSFATSTLLGFSFSSNLLHCSFKYTQSSSFRPVPTFVNVLNSLDFLSYTPAKNPPIPNEARIPFPK
ncbi:MAG: hypothetical protein R3B92_01425 [Patescibacteria group bacterium]